ncbi:MAG: Flp family type IVb pilin [Parvibaculaceae bacterium]|nr:Flp family type IVb pilin [Parvibaculaceae bacterium]
MAAFMRRFAKDESGISAVEYGLLAAGIAVGLWAFVGPEGIGGSLQSVFGGVRDDLASAAPE